jgi:hypothetical protein
MAGCSVAVHAVDDFVAFTQQRLRFMQESRVATEAIVAKGILVASPDDYWLGKILKRECLGMQIAVFSFCEPFGDEFGRQMAINAGCRSVVAGFLPGVVLRLHNMTVHAGYGICAEIGQTLSVLESEKAKSENNSQQGGWQNPTLAHYNSISFALDRKVVMTSESTVFLSSNRLRSW